MDGPDNVDMPVVSVGASAGGSRWNPTKEQMDELENLYKHGLRTPSADEIQQITSRLRAFGQIEGKNVFYWFQNHKARQRQKQKQDNFSHFNRFLHKTAASHFISPCSNVHCSPYSYMPQTERGLCSQQQQQLAKVLLPRSFKRRPILQAAEIKLNKNMLFGTALHNQANQDQHYNATMQNSFRANGECMMHNSRQVSQETLDLFPQQPTGTLQSRPAATVESYPLPSTPFEYPVANTNSSTSSATKSFAAGQMAGYGDRYPFFDFLCGTNGSCE